MQIKLYRLFSTLVICTISFTGLVFIIISLIKQNQLLHLLDRGLHIKFNEFTHQYSKSLQIRLLYSGIFISCISMLLVCFRKRIPYTLLSFQTSSQDIFKKSKTSLSSQFSGSNLKYSVAFLIIFFLSIIIRLHFLSCPMRYDEGFTYFYFSKKSFFLLFFYYDYPNHHIFHTFLVKLSTLIFGDNLVAVRLPAFIFGTALIPLVYIYVAKFYQKNAAILTCAFVAVSSIFISYSVNARGYTITYCVFISLLIIVELLKKHNNNFLWGLFILIQVIGIYTIPTMLYASLIINNYLCISIYFDKNNKPIVTLKKVIVSGIITLLVSILLYLPVCILMGPKYIINNPFVASKTFSYVITHIAETLNLLITVFTTDIPIAGQLVLLLGLLTGLIINKNFRYYLLSFLICLLFIFFVQRVIPYNRVLVFIFLLFFCISASGITHLIKILNTSKQFIIVVVISVFSISSLSLRTINSNSPAKEFDFAPIKDIKPIFSYLKKTVKEKDRLACIFPMEASIKSYFYFYKISPTCFTNDPFNSNKIFVVVGPVIRNKVDFILENTEVDLKKFHKNFYLLKKRVFSDKTEIYEFQHRKK